MLKAIVRTLAPLNLHLTLTKPHYVTLPPPRRVLSAVQQGELIRRGRFSDSAVCEQIIDQITGGAAG